jgi:hypothetical protein
VRVGLEVPRTVDAEHARADIVIRVRDMILVIENKVDAPEGDRQAERLYRVWVDEAPDLRWLLLSPSGRSPTTASSSGARLAWRSLGYRRLAGMIVEAAEDAGPSSAVGSRTVEQYLATLRAMFGSPDVRPAGSIPPSGRST